MNFEKIGDSEAIIKFDASNSIYLYDKDMSLSNNIKIVGFDSNTYAIYDTQNYNILCELQKGCRKVVFYPKANIISLEGIDSCSLVETMDNMVISHSKITGISSEEAEKEILNFFTNKRIVVNPTGFQGKIYNIGRNVQNFVPFIYTVNAISSAKSIGLSGIKVISGAPMTAIGASYVTAVGFQYGSIVCGDNIAGKALGSLSWLFSRPYWAVELVTNGVFLRPLSYSTGIPLVLNATEELVNGYGLNLTDAIKISERASKIVDSGFFKRLANAYSVLFNKTI